MAGCPEALATAYDVALLDLDGVVYVGPDVVPGAADTLAAARDLGMRTAFVTNNAFRTPEEIAAHLLALAIPATEADVVTSAQAAARLLKDRLPPGAPVFVAGGEGLRREVVAAGLTLAAGAEDRPAAVVQGYTPDADYAMLAEATLAVTAGAWWVAANRDATMPSPRGRLPGNGALVALVAAATGRQPVVAGKPEWALHRESVERTSAGHPLVVGDRLDTDILGAVRGGTDSLLVLTGVTDPAELLRCDESSRPTYVAADLDGLLRPHPEVRVDVSGDRVTARCGAWLATADGGRLHLTTDGPPGGDDSESLDPLRALCGAAWAHAMTGSLVPTGASPAAEEALRRLGLLATTSRGA
ncbi:MAG: HAD-IIA family hydrolase [Actinomycetota bacterium]|nr:HAD-IIA family hydrolase [Actinomycetota bacterium]